MNGPPRRASAFALIFSCGCALPAGPQQLAQLATTRERASCGVEVDARLFGRDAIEGVEPFYVVLPSKGGRDRRLAGATLRVRPAPGLTQPLLERNVRCHSARQTLGAEPPDSESPYWLPGGWVQFDFGTEAGALVVRVSAPEPSRAARAGEILSRARAYVSGGPARAAAPPESR
jgi:hypothetical protein